MDLSGGKSIRGTLAFSGEQTVRAIFLGGGERPIADMYVTGSKSIAAPPQVRRAVFIGEGMHPPVGVLPGIGGATALESVGIEHDSVLLALGHHVFAGHGCLLEMGHSPGVRAAAARQRARLRAAPRGQPFPPVLSGCARRVEPRPGGPATRG